MSATVEQAAAAVRAGGVVVVPTDTVYGLAASPHRAEPVRRLYLLKARSDAQPTALVAASLDMLFECVPELRGRVGSVASALLPGPYTLVLPNPAERFPWLCGGDPRAIGVRVPALDGPGRELLDRVGALAATSANAPGGRDPATLEDVPAEIRAGVDALLDGGELPGTPSTVLDLTDAQPRVLRAGAADPQEALRIARSVLV